MHASRAGVLAVGARSCQSARVPMAANTRRAATFLLALASTIVFLLALELGARALGLKTGYFLAWSRPVCLRRSALLEWELLPHCTGWLQKAPMQTNAMGLRG